MRLILDARQDGASIWDIHNPAGTDWDTVRQFARRGFLEQLAKGDGAQPVCRKTLSIDGVASSCYSVQSGY